MVSFIKSFNMEKTTHKGIFYVLFVSISYTDIFSHSKWKQSNMQSLEDSTYTYTQIRSI